MVDLFLPNILTKFDMPGKLGKYTAGGRGGNNVTKALKVAPLCSHREGGNEGSGDRQREDGSKD